MSVSYSEIGDLFEFWIHNGQFDDVFGGGLDIPTFFKFQQQFFAVDIGDVEIVLADPQFERCSFGVAFDGCQLDFCRAIAVTD